MVPSAVGTPSTRSPSAAFVAPANARAHPAAVSVPVARIQASRDSYRQRSCCRAATSCPRMLPGRNIAHSKSAWTEFAVTRAKLAVVAGAIICGFTRSSYRPNGVGVSIALASNLTSSKFTWPPSPQSKLIRSGSPSCGSSAKAS